MAIETLEPKAEGYAGDVRPSVAWRVLETDDRAQLVDVRTAAEWSYVGNPDLTAVEREVVRIEWQSFPEMQVDPAFSRKLAEALAERGVTADTPVFFICRSGARSARAAQAATAAGFGQAYNVASGFEGQPDDKRHRGTVNGWKAEGLPWTQN